SLGQELVRLGTRHCARQRAREVSLYILFAIPFERETRQMSKQRLFTIQHTAYFSPEMWTLLQQLANQRGHGCTENDLIREAVRALIDNQGEIIGSRRHFQKSLQERVDALEKTLSTASVEMSLLIIFYLNVLIQLLAFGLAHLIS